MTPWRDYLPLNEVLKALGEGKAIVCDDGRRYHLRDGRLEFYDRFLDRWDPSGLQLPLTFRCITDIMECGGE